MRQATWVIVVAVAMTGSGTVNAALVSYFHFNQLSIGSAAAPGDGEVPIEILPNGGSGIIDLRSYAGTVNDFDGTADNGLFADSAGASLSLVAGNRDDGTATSIDLIASLTNLRDPIITFATRGTATGYNLGQWSYSTDGVNFTPVAGDTSSNSSSWSIETVDFSGISALSNASSATFRYELSGATHSGGNNRIDNLQLNASAVPEPASVLAIAVLGLAGAWSKRRRASR